MIPVKDVVSIIKTAGLDSWGDPIPGTTVTLKARVSESSEKVVDSNGEAKVSKGVIYFIGFVDIAYSDVIKYTNANGIEVEEHPLNINFKKDLDSNILITKVVI